MTKQVFLLIFIVSTLFSCRTEDLTIISGSNQQTLKANSLVTSLMQQTSMKDGSGDNVIDKANCFCLKLPVSVIVNNMMVDVNLINMIEVCKDKDVQIIFPVTIMLSDHAEVIINNQNAFDGFKNSCNGENEVDEDIECLDFKYPIQAYVYNSASEQSKVVSIDNDKKMYWFIEGLDRHDTTELKFPITLIIYDGTEINVDSLLELEETINLYKDDCNENDRF